MGAHRQGVRRLPGDPGAAWSGARPEDIATAGREIMLRAREATLGVPSETRQALDDGTNAFERILPGPNRMYPDTDLPPVRLENARVQGIAAGLPEPPWQRERQLRELGVGEDLAERLARHRAYDLFLHLAPRLRAGATPLAAGPGLAAARPLLPPPARAWPWPATGGSGSWRAWRGARSCRRGSGTATTSRPPRSPTRRRAARRHAALAALPADGPAEPGRREEWAMGHVMRALRGRVPGRRVRAWLKEARS